ncbi:MAG: TolC family protein [Longimicrobiales bacterium]
MLPASLRPVVMAWVALMALGATAVDASAQVTGGGDLMTLARRPLAELIGALPGREISLQQLLVVARERSLPLEAARVSRQLAETDVDVRGGDFDLALELQAGLARSRALGGRTDAYRVGVGQVLPWGTAIGVDLAGTRLPSGVGSAYDADVGVSLSQPLLEGFRTRDADLRVARLFDQAAAHRLNRATSVVTANVELAYWALAEAEAVEAVLQRSLEIAQALLFRNEQLAERQLVAEVDVLTARSAVALRRSTLVAARSNRESASDALVFLVWGESAVQELASSPEPIKSAPGEVAMTTSSDMATAEGLALERRTDVLAARLDLRGADVVADAASNARLPSLTLDTGVRRGGTDSTLGNALGALDQGWSWSVGLGFSQPLRNRRDRGRDQAADLLRELRRIDLVLTENAVRREVRDAVRGIRAGGERAAAAQEAADLASDQLEAERRRLDLGLGDSFRLLETEENAVQAELESVRSGYDLRRAGTLYRLAVGEIGGA